MKFVLNSNFTTTSHKTKSMHFGFSQKNVSYVWKLKKKISLNEKNCRITKSKTINTLIDQLDQIIIFQCGRDSFFIRQLLINGVFGNMTTRSDFDRNFKPETTQFNYTFEQITHDYRI